MTLDDFLVEHLDRQAFDPPNYLFWTRTVCAAMSLIGLETDPDLERMIRQVLDYHAGTGGDADAIDNIRHEIVRLRGLAFWGDADSLGLKYRCLNAIACSREWVLARGYDEWQYGVVTAFQLINHHHDKDGLLIQFIRESARTQDAELYEAR